MAVLFLVLLLFFAGRALLYFSRGQLFATTFAVLACLLFAGALYADFAGKEKAGAQAAKRSV
ncbi:MAG TPA: hypothetical protein VMG08_18060 [Allosphingosinicella sp.]|nr:hypothetical protein [Allosphingosinicella sp.]